MAEYIEREAAKKAACEGCNAEFGEDPCEPCDCSIMVAIDAIPAADMVERKPLPEDVEELVKDLYAFSKDCTDSDMCRDCQLCFMCEDGWPPNAIAHLIETWKAT